MDADAERGVGAVSRRRQLLGAIAPRVWEGRAAGGPTMMARLLPARREGRAGPGHGEGPRRQVGGEQAG